MSTSRPSFIEIVKDDFKDEAIKNEVISYNKEKFSKKNFDRAFDLVPHLLPENEVMQLIEDFKKILSCLPVPRDENLTVSRAAQANITILEQQIIHVACHEILNEQGQIKSELFDLLECNDYKDQIQPAQFVYAYISAVHQQFIDHLKVEGSPKVSAFFLFLGQHYTQWIRDEMKKNNYHADDVQYEALTQALIVNRIKYFPVDHPVETGIGAGAIAMAIGIGAALFANFLTSKNNASTEPHSTPKPWK